MRIIHLIVAALLLCVAPAHAQSPALPSLIQAQINAEIISCGTGCVSGSELNSILNRMAVSYGGLLSVNTWSGANTFVGTVSLPAGTAETNLANPTSVHTWAATQTFSVNPILTNCNGYLYGNGSSVATCLASTSGAANVCQVDGIHYSTLAAALAVCSSNAEVDVYINQTISAPITIAGNYVTTKCIGGPTITVAAANGFSVSGSGAVVSGCTFYGPGVATLSNGPAFQFSGSNTLFENNKLTNFGLVSTSIANNDPYGIVEYTAGSHHKVVGNTIINNGDWALNFTNNIGSNSITDVIVTGNTLDTISIYDLSVSFYNFTITGNTLYAGRLGGSNSYCNQFGGNVYVLAITFSNNSCTLIANLTAALGPGTGDAYSFGGMQDFTIAGNTLNPGLGLYYANTMYEFNGMLNGAISANQGTSASGGSQGFVFENMGQVAVTGNTANGGWAGGSGFVFWSGVSNGINGSGAPTQRVSVEGNTILFAYGLTGTGISVTNSGTGTTTDINISGNTIAGGSATSTGISFNANSQIMAYITEGPNTIRAVSQGVAVSSGVTSFCHVSGGNYATTPYTNAGAASVCN